MDKILIAGQYDSSQNSRVVWSEGISYAATNGHKDGMPKIIYEVISPRRERCGDMPDNQGNLSQGEHRKPNEGGTFGATGVMEINSELHMEDGCLVDAEGRHYRIRKLTPREVGRLMDVSDSDIDRIEATGLSRTAMYKMYGNSICVGVMFHLFRKLFIETENENQQLSLF